VTDAATLIHALSDFGGLGIVVGFLIWWNVWTEKCRQTIDEQRRAERAVADEKRLQFDKERLAMDKELAANFAALTAVIQNLVRR